MAACHLLIARGFSRTNSEILTSIFTPSALGVNLTVDIAFFASGPHGPRKEPHLPVFRITYIFLCMKGAVSISLEVFPRE
jgi:hypothetical protein